MTRSTLVKGPCKLTHGANVYYSKDDVVVSIEMQTLDISTSAHGKVDERIIDASAKVVFTPCGEWEALTGLWPYAAFVPGQSLYATDVPLVIESLTADKDKITVKAAAVTKCPDIILGAKETLIGQVEFTGVPEDDTEWDDADRLIVIATNGAIPAAASFTTASLITQGYKATWDDFTDFETYDGFRISFGLKTNPIETDRLGVLDHAFETLSVEARFKPILVSSDLKAMLKIDGVGVRRGGSINAFGSDLVITGDTGSVIVTLKKAAAKAGAFHFDSKTPRAGEVVMAASKSIVTDLLYTLA